jgi:hypothetical protein
MVEVLRWSGVLCCVGVVDSPRLGAVVSRRRTQCDGRAQDGGVIWRRGGIDGIPSKDAMIPLEDGVEEDGGSNSCGVGVGVR